MIWRKKISSFHNREGAILYCSCFDANGGLFEALLGKEDTILTDELNHASIIDGIRLSKAKKIIYKHRDMSDLENKLKENVQESRFVLIATDGVFSMDGNIAPLKEICDLSDAYGALTFVDDCHATGFLGKTGRGTEEYCDVMGRVDVINSTLGKAIGGASGGYTTSTNEVVTWLKQKSRPYLFSNTLPPAVVGSASAAFDEICLENSFLQTLTKNTRHFRLEMKRVGFTLGGDDHPICPVMMPNEKTAVSFASDLLDLGIYVIGFTYPVVPTGKARIRVQISSSHSMSEIDQCIDAFINVGRKLGVIS